VHSRPLGIRVENAKSVTFVRRRTIFRLFGFGFSWKFRFQRDDTKKRSTEMMSRADGLVQRRNVNRDSADGVSKENGQSAADKLDYEEDIDDGDSKETRLTLMEEVLLLGLKDKEVNCRCTFTSINIRDSCDRFMKRLCEYLP